MTQKTTEDKIHNVMTYFRVPLVAIAVVALVAYINRIDGFWYGAVVSIYGEMIQMWASSQIYKDQKLTISGPYSFVRNPMYIGRFFVFLGIFIMTMNLYLIGLYIVAFAVYAYLRVKREESRLKKIFAPDYDHYCAEINRWLPKFKAYSKSEAQRSSWSQICVNNENINLMVVIGVLIAIYLRIQFLP